MRLIAFHTFLWFRRRRVFVVFFFSYLLLVFLWLFLGSIALSEQQKVIMDFFLVSTEILWVVWILFFATRLIYNEVRDKTLDLVRLKLKKSYYFFLWKFLWFFMVLFGFFIVIFFLVSFFFLWRGFSDFSYLSLLFALLFIFVKLIVLLVFVMFFSLFLSPVATLFVSLLVYVLSHSTVFLNYYYHSILIHKSVFLEYVMSGLYYMLPNFAQLSSTEVFGSSFDIRFSSAILLINLAYIFVLLFLGIIVYLKRVKYFI